MRSGSYKQRFQRRLSAPGTLAAAICLALSPYALASTNVSGTDSVAISALALTGTAASAAIPARPAEVPARAGTTALSTLDMRILELEGVDDAEAVEEDGSADEDVAVLPHVEESDLALLDTINQFTDEQLATQGDLWSRLRQGFQMDVEIDNDRITTQRNWYLRNSDYLERVARRATRYLHYTVSVAEERNLPTELALLPIIESAYDPFAYSHADAGGMWQFIPGTARIMGLKENEWFDARRDVIESTRAAYDFLSLLYGKFGDWQLALAAYNAGPGAVQRAINRNAAAGLPTDFWSLRLPAETQAYVPRFLAIAQIVKSPESFGVALRPVLNQPYFRVVETGGQVDLPTAASLAGVSLRELFQLNAGFKRQVSDPSGPHRLLVPASLPQDFEADIAALPVPSIVLARSYQVKKGDTLYAVARRFDMSAAELRRINNLKSDSLVAGRTLTINHANVSPEFTRLSQELRLDRARLAATGRASARGNHVVRRGETLASIARRHGMTVSALAKMNGMRANAKVRIGQKLAVSNRNAAVSATQRVAQGSKSQPPGMRKIRYEVRKGDTLSSIGRRYNVTVRQIKTWNGNDASLQPGQGLVLYVASPNNRNM